MSLLGSRLAIISTLSNKIRLLQLENGYSVREINQYLGEVMREVFLSLSINGKKQINNLEILNEQIQVLQRIIECLQIEIYHLTRAQMANLDIKSQSSQIESFSLSPVVVVKKQPKILQVQYNTEEEDAFDYKTPKLETYSDMNWVLQNGFAFQPDLIDKAFEATFERAQLLKKYFSKKMKDNKLKKLSFQPNLERYQLALVD